MANRPGMTIPDGCAFTYANKKDAVCATPGCDRVSKNVNRYYLFKYGDKKICRLCARERKII